MQAGVNALMIQGSEEILNEIVSHILFCYAEVCVIFIFTSVLQLFTYEQPRSTIRINTHSARQIYIEDKWNNRHTQ
jgi:hypothetical protein